MSALIDFAPFQNLTLSDLEAYFKLFQVQIEKKKEGIINLVFFVIQVV